MNICMLLDKPFPPDIRVEKEAKVLVASDHNVMLVSLLKPGQSAVETISGIKNIRLDFKQNPFLRVANLLYFNLFFDSIFWKKELSRIVNTEQIDAIHVHDLPLAKAASAVCKSNNIPLIVDLHENYPEAIRVHRDRPLPFRKRLLHLLTPVDRWKAYEKTILQEADRAITVIEEAKEHYVHDCGLPPEKVTIVMNAEDIDSFDDYEKDSTLTDRYKNRFVISYIGGLGPHRGIDTAIKAMPAILEAIPSALLLLVGKGLPEYEAEVHELCRQLNVENAVDFTGWVNFWKVPAYIAISRICLVPHHSNTHTNTTIPHKLFQYMSLKKPVIVTDCPPLKRIIKESDAGLVIPSGDFQELKNAVLKLHNDPQYSELLGNNGRLAVENRYNWAVESGRLNQLYLELESSSKKEQTFPERENKE